MVQPAGHIRIITEELTKDHDSIGRQVIPGLQHVGIGLPLLHLLEPAPGNPDKGIDPVEAAHDLEDDPLRRVGVAHVAPLVAEDHLAAQTRARGTHEDGPQEGEGRRNGGMLGQRIAVTGREVRPAAQAPDTQHPHPEQSQRQQHHRAIERRDTPAPRGGTVRRRGPRHSGGLGGKRPDIGIGRRPGRCGIPGGQNSFGGRLDQRQRIEDRIGRVERDVERRNHRRNHHCRHQIAAAGPIGNAAHKQQAVEAQQQAAAKEHFQEVEQGGFHGDRVK